MPIKTSTLESHCHPTLLNSHTHTHTHTRTHARTHTHTHGDAGVHSADQTGTLDFVVSTSGTTVACNGEAFAFDGVSVITLTTVCWGGGGVFSMSGLES